jgi:hypothetical protein
MVDAASGGRSDAQHLLGLIGQCLQAGSQDVPQGGRYAAVADGGEQFLREERVALGAVGDFGCEPVGHVTAGNRRQQLRDLALTERFDVEAADVRQAIEFGQQGAQRVRPAHLVGAVRPDQQDPGVLEFASQIGDQVEGGTVGPLQVLDDQDERAVIVQIGEQAVERAEQFAGRMGRPLRGGAVLREETPQLTSVELLRSLRAELLAELTQHADEWGERQHCLT